MKHDNWCINDNCVTSEERVYHPHVEAITSALISHFGCPNLGNKKNPFNELLFILLSSRTPPERYKEVYQALRLRYPLADDLANAAWPEVARVISRAGLQNRKAKAIVTIAKRLTSEFGRVTLSPLKQKTDVQVEQFLTSLPEISLKSARCIMMYSLHRQVFPVDTHGFRISNRLGWVKNNTEFSWKQANALQEGVPPPLRYNLHVGMVLLGRNYCTAHNQRCNKCPIMNYCPMGQTRTSN